MKLIDCSLRQMRQGPRVPRVELSLAAGSTSQDWLQAIDTINAATLWKTSRTAQVLTKK